MNALRIALAQLNVTVGDLEGNCRKIEEAMLRAREAGAGLVTFPELALSGYPPEDLLLKPRFLSDARRALEDLARRTTNITALVGFPDWDGRRAYNAAALLEAGRIALVYHKVELPNYGVFDEKRYFAPGSAAVTFQMSGLPVAITICEDIWVEDSLPERHARQDAARLILNISASPFHAGKQSARHQVAERLARHTGAVVAYNNLVGGQDELVFDGGSFVLNPQGELCAAAACFDEDLLLFDLDPQDPAAVRSLAPVPPALGHAEEVYRALVLGVRDYLRKNGFQKAVIGMSGGIDSAVTAAIAADALGSGNVIAATMPSQFTSSETLADSVLISQNLGLQLLSIPIKSVHASYLDALAPAFGPGPLGIEAENIQARIRGNFLMALSNRFGWLVLTTGNKSETACGYCTLYGDMAGGFAVIKDVPKTLVYEIADDINRRAGRALIPQSIIDRPPSAELKPDQKDSDSLPPYPLLDRILQLYVEEDADPEDIVTAGFDRAVVEKVVRMVDRNEYKRRQAAPGIKITPKAFGRDRRLPITNQYRPFNKK